MLKLFSVDDHIVEPADVWTKRLPKKSRRRALTSLTLRDGSSGCSKINARQPWDSTRWPARTLRIGAPIRSGSPT